MKFLLTKYLLTKYIIKWRDTIKTSSYNILKETALSLIDKFTCLRKTISTNHLQLVWTGDIEYIRLVLVRRTGVDGKLEGVGQGEARPREAERGAPAEVGGAQTAGSRRATLPRAAWGRTTKTHRWTQISW